MGLDISDSLVTYTDAGGPQYSFSWDGSEWERASTSYFLDAVLSQSGSTWLLTFPDTSYYVFSDVGRLLQMVDSHGNATTLTWAGSRLLFVSEPQGRTIQFGYSPDGQSTLR